MAKDIDLNSLKKQFIQENNGSSKDKKNNAEDDSLSIYFQNEEFKDFVKEETGVKESSISFDVKKLKKLDVEDGQFVVPKSEKAGLFDNITKNQKMSNAFYNFTVEELNEVLAQENTIRLLDSDNSGYLNQDEIEAFVDKINNDDKKLTFDELSKGIQSLADNSYNSAQKPSEFIDFSDSELSDKKEELQAGYDEAQEELTSLYNGENPKIQEAQARFDDAQKKYQKAIETNEKINDNLKNSQTTYTLQTEISGDDMKQYNLQKLEKLSQAKQLEVKIQDITTAIDGYNQVLSNLRNAVRMPKNKIKSKKISVMFKLK